MCLKIDENASENVMWQSHWTAAWVVVYLGYFIPYTMLQCTCVPLYWISKVRTKTWIESKQYGWQHNPTHNQMYTTTFVISYIQIQILSEYYSIHNIAMYRDGDSIEVYQSPDFDFREKTERKKFHIISTVLCLLFDMACAVLCQSVGFINFSTRHRQIYKKTLPLPQTQTQTQAHLHIRRIVISIIFFCVSSYWINWYPLRFSYTHITCSFFWIFNRILGMKKSINESQWMHCICIISTFVSLLFIQFTYRFLLNFSLFLFLNEITHQFKPL